LKDLTALDQHYGLGVIKNGNPVAGETAQADRSPSSSSQLDTVPNTGGVMDRPVDQMQPLSGTMRSRVTNLLAQAKEADDKGDGTTCTTRLKEARQLAQQAPGSPSDLH
jgi:hypothetical protein